VPVAVSGITNAASLIGGDSNIAGPSVYCAVLTTGSVDCWGENGSGELGDGNTTSSDVPVAVTGLTDAISVSDDGYQALCALLTTGSVECWGDNQNGESGNGTIGFTIPYTDVPVTVSSIDNAVSLSNDGTGAFCAVLASGGVDCWGSNNLGQLGDGTTGGTNSMCGDYCIPYPVAVSGITDAVSISSNGYYSESFCAVLSTHRVDCWGQNTSGELGDGTTTNSDVPVAVTGLTDASSVASNGRSTRCAELTTGGVDCWGLGFDYALGDGSRSNSSVPVAVDFPPLKVTCTKVTGSETSQAISGCTGPGTVVTKTTGTFTASTKTIKWATSKTSVLKVTYKDSSATTCPTVSKYTKDFLETESGTVTGGVAAMVGGAVSGKYCVYKLTASPHTIIVKNDGSLTV
jgi:alpha-tubulin suppressor-like RCC1 family protein